MRPPDIGGFLLVTMAAVCVLASWELLARVDFMQPFAGGKIVRDALMYLGMRGRFVSYHSLGETRIRDPEIMVHP